MDNLVVMLVAAGATLVAVGLGHRIGIPTPVVLVVAGLVIGFVPVVPDVSLQPDVILLGLLPLLVYDAAKLSSPTALLRNAESIGAVAVLLVAITACVVAGAAHWLGHLSWPIAFVLGTSVGATDASAATTIANRLGLPRRLAALLEGEALFNDATALVLYTAAVTAATTGHFSALATVGDVIYSTVAGVAIGLLVGTAGRWLRDQIDDSPIEIVGSIVLAYAAYIPAEELHTSGVLAAVTAGLYLGWHHTGDRTSVATRLQSAAFWDVLVFLVNSILFVLVGLSFHAFITTARASLEHLTLTALVVVATVIVVRLVWMGAIGAAADRIRSSRRASDQRGWRERLILGWSGMRGAITLAALLAVPAVTSDGRPLAGRDDIVFIGYTVIIVTLLAEALTLPLLVKRLEVREHPAVLDTERRARLRLVRSALRQLDGESAIADLPTGLAEGLRAQYLNQLARLQATVDGRLPGADTTATTDLAVRRDLNRLQRRVLRDLLDEGEIGVTTLRIIERDLDLEEAHLAASISATGEHVGRERSG